MQRAAVAVCLGIVLTWGPSAVSGQDSDNVSTKPFDPAARAELVARYVGANAFLVGHLDVARFKVEPLFALLKRLSPRDAEQIEFTQATVEQSVEQFLKAGGREAFVVLTPSLTPLLVVPLAVDMDEATVLAILGELPLETVEKLDGAIVAGSQEAVSRLHKAKPASRPGLTKAFAAAGNSTAQLLLIPTDEARAMIEPLLLKQEPGGAANRAGKRLLDWAALGIDDAPQLSLRLVAEAVDAQAAARLADRVGGWADLLLNLPALPNPPADRDAVRELLTPKVSEKQLVLELSAPQLLDRLGIPPDAVRGAE